MFRVEGTGCKDQAPPQVAVDPCIPLKSFVPLISCTASLPENVFEDPWFLVGNEGFRGLHRAFKGAIPY